MADEPENLDEFETPETDEEVVNEPENEPDLETDHSNRFKFRSYKPAASTNLAGNLLKLGAALVLIVALIFGGREIHHHFFVKTPATVPAGSSGSAPAQPKVSTTTGSSKSSSTKSNSSSTGKGTGQITNTGPGDPLAVFAGAVIVASSLHFVVTARKRA